ncbi:caspase-3 isoform X1 [Hydra vulgaris]|uniref:caspase-3 isoform X1 n=1 Tax=Hydra vulgaris TaxID=6087 RepID=UPI0001924FCA|nr:caspase-3-like [Hydra vulgaris]
MDNLNNNKKRNKDNLNDTESIDVNDAPSKKFKMHEDGVSISTLKNMIQTNESLSSTQSKAEDIIRKQETVLVRNDEDDIQFSHIRYFPDEPKIDLLKVDFKFNSDNFYNTNTFPRGTLTIINVKNFMKSSNMHEYPRLGTDVDAESLCDLFLKLGFKIDRFNNPKSTDVLNILKQAANEDYSLMSCCVVAVLTHGKEGEIFCTNDTLNISEITNIFCTKALAGKPKLFLIQACRGTEYMESLDKVDGLGTGLSNKANVLDLPVESDFLYAYSTVLGYYSWRNEELGSWFVKAVVSVFCDYAHKMDVVRLLTRVNEVLSEKTSNTRDIRKNNKKQIGSIISQLRKELFLPPIYGPMEPL